jgi:hypothetical protein
MATDIREHAKEILNAVPPLGQQINSDGPTAALFTKLTGGVTHDQLVKNWQAGGIMTTCNEFVGWYARALGSTEYLGRFDIETFLTKIGKGHAWVLAGTGARPKYGDIFRPKSLHMGISLDFDGDTWNTAESGQGGPIAGRDIMKRKQTTFDASKLQGWVDLELYFDYPAQIAPVPEWLVGWWKVTWRGQAYYYYFDRNRQVKWTQVLPQDISAPALIGSDTGKFAVQPPISVATLWSATGSIEKFNRVPATDAEEEMWGKWNDTEPLTAVKM